MKALKTGIVSLSVMAMMFTGCKQNPNSPGVEYMPDMYRSPAVEAYVDYGLDYNNISKEDEDYKLSSRKPVEGTIPRGFMPYPYPNTVDGYEMAGENLKNPIPCSEAVMETGKDLFDKFCSHCHGKKGDGQGQIVQRGKFPPPPAYDGPLKDLPVGKMYHTLQYGKGLMGSHASQLTPDERWMIIHYIQKLQGKEKCEVTGKAAEEVMEDGEMNAEEMKSEETPAEGHEAAGHEGEHNTDNETQG